MILLCLEVVNLFLNYVMVCFIYKYIYIYIYIERERERERERESYTLNYEITLVHFVMLHLANMINLSLGQYFSKLCYDAFCILAYVDMLGHKYLHMK